MFVCVQPTVGAPIANAPPSKSVVIAEVIGNPDPVIESDSAGPVEIAPLVLDSVIDDSVFVRVEAAVLKKLSVTEIACAAAGKFGTVKVAIMLLPMMVLVAVVNMPSMVTDSSAFAALFATPVTTTVAVVPTAAGLGDTTATGVPVFVKGIEPAIPVVVTWCVPAPDEGTVNEP